MERDRARRSGLNYHALILFSICAYAGCAEEPRPASPRDATPAGPSSESTGSPPPPPAAEAGGAGGGSGFPQHKDDHPRPTDKAEAPKRDDDADKKAEEAKDEAPRKGTDNGHSQPTPSAVRPGHAPGIPPEVGMLEAAKAQAEEGLKKAEVAFNKPKSMRLGDTVPVQLRLSRSSAADALKKGITGPGSVEVAEILVSRLVVARLAGAGFDVKAGVGSDRPQAVKADGVNYWEWDVTALAPGKHELHLTVSSIVRVEGTEAEDQILSLDEPIDIEVTWSQRVSGFLGSNWQWLWTVVVIPAGGYLITKRRKGSDARDASKPAASDPGDAPRPLG